MLANHVQIFLRNEFAVHLGKDPGLIIVGSNVQRLDAEPLKRRYNVVPPKLFLTGKLEFVGNRVQCLQSLGVLRGSIGIPMTIDHEVLQFRHRNDLELTGLGLLSRHALFEVDLLSHIHCRS